MDIGVAVALTASDVGVTVLGRMVEQAESSLWFQRVPEGKVAKNRQHFDLRVVGDVPVEVRRLTDLGARLLKDDHGQIVMADPEGNEFCLET